MSIHLHKNQQCFLELVSCQLELKVLANDSEKKKKAGIRIVLTYDSQVKKNKTQKTESTVTKISKNFLQKNT